MSRISSLFSRRLPLYIWLPIVLACAVAGYIASTLRPLPSTPHLPRAARPSQVPVITSPAHELPRTAESQLARALGSPHGIPAIAPPNDEVEDLQGSVRSVVERRKQAPADVGAPALAAKRNPPRARTAREHSLAKPRRPQRAAQQPANARSSSSAGLKSVPVIGPVFSLLQ
jgi:hypothetical protein